jgi:hypothetical protein
MIVDLAWYVSNETLHSDLGISTVRDVIQQKGSRYHNKLATHKTPLLKALLTREDNRRLKRSWPIDLYCGSEGSPLDDSSSLHYNNLNISS